MIFFTIICLREYACEHTCTRRTRPWLHLAVNSSHRPAEALSFRQTIPPTPFYFSLEEEEQRIQHFTSSSTLWTKRPSSKQSTQHTARCCQVHRSPTRLCKPLHSHDQSCHPQQSSHSVEQNSFGVLRQHFSAAIPHRLLWHPVLRLPSGCTSDMTPSAFASLAVPEGCLWIDWLGCLRRYSNGDGSGQVTYLLYVLLAWD